MLRIYEHPEKEVVMEKISEKLSRFLQLRDKEKAVGYVLDILRRGETDVIEFYSDILTPLLNGTECIMKDEKICIWQEHVRTAIVRTIVECCYPYVIEKRNELNMPKRGTAAVLCPPDEAHDLGARIAADFFVIAGYDTIFTGSCTPYRDFCNALRAVKPDIAAISISNYYNLVGAKKMIEEIRREAGPGLRIVSGGNAFICDRQKKIESIGADLYVEKYEDIMKLDQ